MSATGFLESPEDLFEHAPCGYLSTDLGGRILRVNQTFLAWTALDRRRLESGDQRIQDVLTAGGRILFETQWAPMLHMQGMIREIAVDIVCADGQRLPTLMNGAVRRDASGDPIGLRLTLLDATERRSYERELISARDAEREARHLAEQLRARLEALNAELERVANVDVLTGIANRRALQTQLRAAQGRASRHGADFGVVIIDVDYFKRTNDTHGHEAGDAVLRAIAERLRDSIRVEDVAGRWGGEEFLVIAPDTPGDGLAVLGERIRSVIREAPVRYGDRDIRVTASLGCAAWQEDGIDSLLRRADEALYAAKAGGRDRVVAAHTLAAA